MSSFLETHASKGDRKRPFIFNNLSFDQLKEDHLHWNSLEKIAYNHHGQIKVEHLELNQGNFTLLDNNQIRHCLSLIQQENLLLLVCNCPGSSEKLCSHQVQLMLHIMHRDDWKIFFSYRLRQQKLKIYAGDYGLEKEEILDLYFQVRYENDQILVKPKLTGLLPVNRNILQEMTKEVQTEPSHAEILKNHHRPNLLVLRKHKYYHYLIIDLYHARMSREGKPKNPFITISPLQCLWNYSDADELKFLIAVTQFQKRQDHKITSSDLQALRILIKNTLQCQIYVHDGSISENVTAASISPITLRSFPDTIQLNIARRDFFYELTGNVYLLEQKIDLQNLPLQYGCFLFVESTYFLLNNIPLLGIMDLITKNSGKLIIHQSKFAEFKREFLDLIEDKIKITYEHIAPATDAQVIEYAFDKDIEQMIYLTDLGEFVKLEPIVRYSDVEINIRTKRAIYGIDKDGTEFLVERDHALEVQFMSLLIKQHPYLSEQLDNELDYLYLHRKQFLDEKWFLKTFAEWREKGLTILGFNTLKNNKFNAHTARVNVQVVSGINWFETKVSVSYGKRKASLKKIQIALRNKSKYIPLDDGSIGILPEEWIEKFKAYFQAGDITPEDTIKTPKINFSTIEEIYEKEMLEEKAQLDIQQYREKFSHLQRIKNISLPSEFNGSLRSYQKKGLNWLNFLDELNFGGCLADDMGLGKTIQILAFILTQNKKIANNNNLIVVPTSLIFNWKEEIEKFTPTLKTHVVQGRDRIRQTDHFKEFQIILISYNYLLSDINYLRKFTFNYVFLDESQNIKNPKSQRYQAVMKLKSRNRIAVTGTPVENNTFDLFSQFSFACPGLLGNRQYFQDIYSIPIDKFKDSRRAAYLRQKIEPFLLRRTKKQVAKDLPAKTEMVLYCELKPEQRKIYDAYEKEFRDYISATGNDELKKNAMHVLRGLTKLRQICNSPSLIGLEIPTESSSAKMDILLEQIESQAPQHKLLIFSQFVAMLDLIKAELDERGYNYVMLTGSTRN
ncbi:MAG: DEAD/DEAH box helicase [Saprospiraceae bacterium]|nr:DEAD/DEAH box helicase [Saprospiraceae bacterium]